MRKIHFYSYVFLSWYGSVGSFIKWNCLTDNLINRWINTIHIAVWLNNWLCLDFETWFLCYIKRQLNAKISQVLHPRRVTPQQRRGHNMPRSLISAKHALLTAGEGRSFFFHPPSDTVNQQSHFKLRRKRSSRVKGERSGSALHACANKCCLLSALNRISHLVEPQTVESARPDPPPEM